jgi:hypothetical protein
MITAKMVPVYDWGDIEKELCVLIGIDPKFFRNYHEVVGGEYKDFWHVALDTFVPDNMSNGTIVPMFRDDEQWFDGNKKYTGENEWKLLLLQAWNKLYDELDEQNGGKDSGIAVRFAW